MTRPFLSLVLAAAMAAPGAIRHASHQSASVSQSAQAVVVPVRVPRPVYPPIAVSARISGEVEVKVAVRPDGSVESAAIVRSVSLLSQAALQAAQKSQFECRDCSESTPYSLVFAFRLGETTTPPEDAQQRDIVSVTPSQSRITIVAAAQIAIFEFSAVAVRSPKCLWLWTCGSHWGGYDFYYYRVRSAKCLWLWKCGYRPRI